MAASRDNHGSGAARLRGESGITLIELLVAIVISSILSTMMVTSWLALNTSYATSVSSSKARDTGRQALSRMEREVRDSEAISGTWVQPGLPPYQFTLKEEPMILRSRPWTLVFTSTFNESGNGNPSKVPTLRCYRLYYDAATDKAELWRFEDLNVDGQIKNVRFYSGDEPTSNGRPNFDLTERSKGEGSELITGNVSNPVTDLAEPIPLFTYTGYFGTSTVSTWESDVRDKGNRVNIRSVRIQLLIDLNPRRSPVYADLMTTAQLRNQRQF